MAGWTLQERIAAQVLGAAIVVRILTNLVLESGSTPRLLVGIGFFAILVWVGLVALVGVLHRWSKLR